MASPDEKVAIENCSAFPGYNGNNGGGDEGGDYGDYDDECETECNCDYDDEQCWNACNQCEDDAYGHDEEGENDGGEGDDYYEENDDGADEGEVSGLRFPCECEYEDIVCWLECYECLEAHFSGDDANEGDDIDEGDNGEDEGEIDGV